MAYGDTLILLDDNKCGSIDKNTQQGGEEEYASKCCYYCLLTLREFGTESSARDAFNSFKIARQKFGNTKEYKYDFFLSKAY